MLRKEGEGGGGVIDENGACTLLMSWKKGIGMGMRKIIWRAI